MFSALLDIILISMKILVTIIKILSKTRTFLKNICNNCINKKQDFNVLFPPELQLCNICILKSFVSFI